MISRRGVLLSGGAAVLAAGAGAAVELGVLPGRVRLAQALSCCELDAPLPGRAICRLGQPL
jgi:hypothetical protein